MSRQAAEALRFQPLSLAVQQRDVVTQHGAVKLVQVRSGQGVQHGGQQPAQGFLVRYPADGRITVEHVFDDAGRL